MTTTEEKQEKIALEMAASASKGALVEKIVFAGIPILFSCVVYLMGSLSTANNEIIQLKGKIAVVVNADNKAIPPQGTTIDMAQIREALNDKIERVEREAALARAAMTLDREKSMSAIEKSRMDMNADAAQARAAIRFDMAQLIAALDKRVTLLEKDK
jgi:predicted peptidase